ncbi:MAG: YaiI/YqxD family protein [Pseudomonadota bacterium]
MHIWVDADACPRAIKDVLFRAADRRAIPMTLVANQFLKTPPSRHIDSLIVPGGFDVADDTIVERMATGDLVITADVPLADQVVSRGGGALNPRGTLYTEQNIKDHLSRRDMLDELRSSGVQTGGPPPLDKKDVQTFANALDRYLTRHAR